MAVIRYELGFFDVDPSTLPVITSPKLYYKGKYSAKGLFSEQIFGPVKDYTCQCKIKNEDGGTCSKCGVKFMPSSKRRHQLAKINLITHFMNPLFGWMYKLSNKSRSRNIIFKTLYNLIYYISYGVRIDGEVEELTLIPFNTLPEETTLGSASTNRYIGALGAYKYLCEIIDAKPELVKKNKFFEFFNVHRDKFLIKHLLVLPPDLRPDMEMNKSKIINELNRQYLQILNRLATIKDTNMFATLVLANDLRGFQVDLDKVYDIIAKKLTGKKGLIRHNMLGKRIDFSGRAVITPDPTLKLDEVRIPYFILLEVFKYHITSNLALKNNSKLFHHEIVQKINDMIRDEVVDAEYKQELEKIIAGKYCILNRQPTLHKHGLLAFKIIISPDKTIKLNCLAYMPFNADNDGDTMSVYVPLTDEAQREAKEKLSILNNMTYDINNNIAYQFSQDMVYGLYMANKYDKYKKYLPKYFVEMCPPGIELTKKNLVMILNKALAKDKELAIRLLNDLKGVGFKVATLANVPLTLENMAEVALSREDIEKTYYTHEGGKEDIRKNMAEEVELNKNVFDKFKNIDYIRSGARGSEEQLKQLLTARGYVSQCDGNVIEKPVKNNLFNGLTPEEFFISAFGTRKGLVDTADSTSISGKLCRDIVYACVDAELDPKQPDCGSNSFYFDLYVLNKEMASLLIGRWMDVDGTLVQITRYNYLTIIKKVIRLRSPIYCKSKKFCKICAPYNVRTHAIAGAMGLGEITTQKVLQTFHFSGVAQMKSGGESDDGQNEDIIQDLSVLSRIFSKPGDFKLKSFAKPEPYFYELYKVFAEHKGVNPIFFEYIISQMFWNMDEEILYRLTDYSGKCSAISINTIPKMSSWLTGIAHSHFKRKLLQSIGKINDNNLFDKIILDLIKYETGHC